MRAVLDANALVPLYLADLLLTCADQDLFVPLWSRQILAETERNIVEVARKQADRRGLPFNERTVIPGAERRIASMSQAFPEAHVEGFELLTPAMQNDEKDRHVLAAAAHARADVIVTDDGKGFERSAVRRARQELRILTPDEFLQELLETHPAEVTAALRSVQTKRRQPQVTVEAVVGKLGKTVPCSAKRLSELMASETDLSPASPEAADG